MKYVIVDDNGADCGGSICKEWNTIEELRCAVAGTWRQQYYAGKIRILLIFEVDELLDDIERVATVQGNAAKRRLTANDGEKASLAIDLFQEVTEDENLPWVRRSMNLALSDCETFLYRLSKQRIAGNESEANTRDGKQELMIELKVPDTFSDTTMMKLLNSVHDYIISRVLWEWSNITYAELAEFWAKKMERDEAEITKECKRNDCEEARIRPSDW